MYKTSVLISRVIKQVTKYKVGSVSTCTATAVLQRYFNNSTTCHKAATNRNDQT